VRILIAGGGTGGHLFPAVALADAFMEKEPKSRIEFVATSRILDSRILGKRGFAFKILEVEGIKGKGSAGKIDALFRLPKAFRRSLEMIGAFRPDVVLGVGGYVSGPLVLAAWIKGIPSAIQEQNSIPGMTNRWLGKITDRVFCAFEECAAYFPKEKIRLTGNPLRQELRQTAQPEVAPSGSLTLLILGGSQGAHAINMALIDSLAELIPFKEEITFIHQTGEKDADPVALAYQEKGFRHRVAAFISDMPGAYAQADMIISRAGAMSVSEITALGKPSLLIPFPFAANNHQEYNARSLVKAGAAEMILEKDLRPGLLSERIRAWLADRTQLIDMGDKARSLGRLAAAEEIVEECYRLVETHKKGFKGSRIQGIR
jgi:UDP-N-acetylglucosamine--N-acetylmuramyl-(pentapeptide) pyrophosphoryl-undecaprenol N-acetylglucosamine transferase